MGYYSDFTIKVGNGYREETRKVKEMLCLIPGIDYDFQSMKHPEEPDSWFIYVQDAKWYEYKEHICQITLDMPALIEVLIEGEEHGDIRKTFFKDGKYADYKAKLMFKAFDEQDLKEYVRK